MDNQVEVAMVGLSEQESIAVVVAVERERLREAVVEAAVTRRKAKMAKPDGVGDYIELLHATMIAEHKAIDALLAFESQHGLTK